MMMINNPNRLAISFLAFNDLIETTKLALMFRIDGDDAVFYDLNSVIDALIANESTGFVVKNPLTQYSTMLCTNGLCVMPLNLESFEIFIAQIAGFNIHSELFALQQVNYKNISEF